MKQTIAKLLPITIVFASVVGVLSWYAKNKENKPQIKPEIVNPSDLESATTNPSPTTSFFFSDESKTAEAQPSIIPETSKDHSSDGKGSSSELNLKGTVQTVEPSTTTIAETQVCTPVYGMADTCQEHITVDTGAESAVAYSFSFLSYLGGLIAFVKSKKD